MTIHQGKELSFTNLLDLDAAARIVLEFTEPAASVIKHTNPCGVATGADAADAYVRAREADPLSAFGGIIGLNRTLDAATAEAIVSTFIEAVVAPDVDDAARAILARKANLRVVTADFAALASAASLEWRSILGASLVQQRDRVIEARSPVGQPRANSRWSPSGSPPPRSGRRSASRGACARTSSPTRSCLPPRTARWVSARGR